MRNFIPYLVTLSLALIGPGTSLAVSQSANEPKEETSSIVLVNELKFTEKRAFLPEEDTLTIEEEMRILRQHMSSNSKEKEEKQQKQKKEEQKRKAEKQQKPKKKTGVVHIQKKHTHKRHTSKTHTPSKNTYAKSSRLADIVVAEALKHIGSNYRYGATGPNKFDCSGLTQYVYRKVGISLPRTSRAQSQVGTPVSFNNLRKGDLVYFGNGISHVGIYMGGGRFVSALNEKKGILIQDINISYWKKHFVTGRRVLQ